MTKEHTPYKKLKIFAINYVKFLKLNTLSFSISCSVKLVII